MSTNTPSKSNMQQVIISVLLFSRTKQTEAASKTISTGQPDHRPCVGIEQVLHDTQRQHHARNMTHQLDERGTLFRNGSGSGGWLRRQPTAEKSLVDDSAPPSGSTSSLYFENSSGGYSRVRNAVKSTVNSQNSPRLI